ncbi:MAG: hypothetical protein AAFQ32_18410 [Pseudomonadota bacterium]
MPGSFHHIDDGYAPVQLVMIPLQNLWRKHTQKTDLNRMGIARGVDDRPLEYDRWRKKRGACKVADVGLHHRAGHPAIKSLGGLKPKVEIMVAQRHGVITQIINRLAGGMSCGRTFTKQRSHWCALQQITRIKQKRCALRACCLDDTCCAGKSTVRVGCIAEIIIGQHVHMHITGLKYSQCGRDWHLTPFSPCSKLLVREIIATLACAWQKHCVKMPIMRWVLKILGTEHEIGGNGDLWRISAGPRRTDAWQA